jgi:hypothetical protein
MVELMSVGFNTCTRNRKKCTHYIQEKNSMELSYKIIVVRSGILLILFVSTPFAQAALISDLLITEVMADPSEVSDSKGEWFELFNPMTESVDLNQIYIKDDGSNIHQIDHGGPLLILPNQYFVLGRNESNFTNGGFTADYVYSSFALGNTGDEIVFSNDADGYDELLRLDYNLSFVSAGRARELMTDGSYQLTSSAFIYGLGDIGTPGYSSSASSSIATIPLPPTGSLLMFGLYFCLLRKICGRLMGTGNAQIA